MINHKTIPPLNYLTHFCFLIPIQSSVITLLISKSSTIDLCKFTNWQSNHSNRNSCLFFYFRVLSRSLSHFICSPNNTFTPTPSNNEEIICDTKSLQSPSPVYTTLLVTPPSPKRTAQQKED